MSVSEAELRLAAAANAHLSWANTTNRPARTSAARAARDAKFIEQAGGDPIRAEHLRKAYFARLALKSAQSRRKAAEMVASAEEAEALLEQAGGPDAAA